MTFLDFIKQIFDMPPETWLALIVVVAGGVFVFRDLREHH